MLFCIRQYNRVLIKHTIVSESAVCCTGSDGLYWAQESDGGLRANNSDPQPFIFELRGLSRFSIKAPNGCYMKGEQNGIVSAKSADLAGATLWEY